TNGFFLSSRETRRRSNNSFISLAECSRDFFMSDLISTEVRGRSKRSCNTTRSVARSSVRASSAAFVVVTCFIFSSSLLGSRSASASEGGEEGPTQHHEGADQRSREVSD